MTIEFEPQTKAGKTNYAASPTAYVKVTVGSTVTFEGNISTTGSGDPYGASDDAIHLQSHWGSGVKFTSIEIVPKT